MSPRVHIPGKEIDDIKDDKEEDVEEKALEHELQQYCARRKRSSTTAITKPTSSSVFDGFDYHTGFTLEDEEEEEEEDTFKEEEDEMQEQNSNKNFDNSSNHNLFDRDKDKVDKSEEEKEEEEEEEEGNVSNHDVATGDKNEVIEEEEKTVLLESINPSEQLPSPARKKPCASNQNHDEKSSSIPAFNIIHNREDRVLSESSPILNERPMETETEESSGYYAGDTQPFATSINLLKTNTNVLGIAGDALQDEKLLPQNLQVTSQKRLDSQRSTGSQSTATLSLSLDVTRERNTPLYNLAIARNVSTYLDVNATTQHSNELNNSCATNLREDSETKSSSGNERNDVKRIPEKNHEEDDDPNMTPSQVLLTPVLTAAKELEHNVEHDDECIASPRNEQVKGLGLRIQTSHTTNQEKQQNTKPSKENANNNATTLESRQETSSLSATANSVDNLKSPTVENKSIVAVKKKQYVSPKSPQWLNAVSLKKTSLVTHKSELSRQLISKDSYELHDTPPTACDDDGDNEEGKEGQSIPITKGKRVRWSSDMGDRKKSGSALGSLNFDHPSLVKNGSGKNQQKSNNLSTDSIVNDASIQEKLDDKNMDAEDIDSVTDHAILSQGMQDLISYREQLTTKAADVDAVHRAKLAKYLDEVNHVNDLEDKIQRQSEDISRLTIRNETLVAENTRYQEQLHQRDNLIKKLKGRIALEQKKQSVLDEIKKLHDERIKALLEDQKKLKKVIEEQRLRVMREHSVQSECKPRGNDECDGSTVGKMASKANELKLNEKTTTPTKKSRKAVTQKTVKTSSSKKSSIAKARLTKLKPSSKAHSSLSPSMDKKGTQTQESQESEFEYCDEKIEYHEDSGEEDTEILSAGKMLTCRSMNVIAQILNTAPIPTTASFNREVFNPIWLTLQQQGGSCECQWHYIQTGSFLGPTHAFSSPHCFSVKNGVAGEDYFVSEVDLILQVIKILNKNRRVVKDAITEAVQRIKEQSSRGRRSRRLNKQSTPPKLEKKHVAGKKTVKSTSTPRLSQSKASNNMSNKINSTISSKLKRRSIESSSSEEDDHEDKGKDEENNDIQANQDSTLDPGHTLTTDSVFKCSQVINQFGGGKSIIKDLFTPIWSILKSQGRSKTHRWKYKNIPQRSQFGLLCNYAWATPHCLSVAKGKLDVDFFITELDLVMYVCRTIKTSHPDHIQCDILKQLESFQRDSASPAPSNGGNVAKDEGRKLTFGVASKLCSNDLAMSPSNTTRDSISAVMTESTPQKGPLEYSQTSYDAAEVLIGLGLAKDRPEVISQQAKPSSNISRKARARNTVPKLDLNDVLPSISPDKSGIYEVGTHDLIQELAKERRTNPVFVKIKKLIREEKKLLLSQIEHESPVRGKVSSFHLTQESPIEERLSFQSASKRRKLNSRRDRLLSGFSFLVSGVDEKARLQINEMGGTIINDLQSLPQPLRNILFISNWTQRRSYKYLFAVSSGMLMLDSSYIKELKLRDDRYKKNSRRSTCIPPDPLDKNLISQMRLPLGLNRLSQRYKLGANNIMKRDEYIRNAKIFDSMNLAVVLRSEEASANWKMILEQGGAHVTISTKEAQSGNRTVDIILIDSVNLPSLGVVQNDLYKTLNVYGKDTPVIDISWAIQCLINGKRLEYGIDSKMFPEIDVFGNDVKGRDITSYRNKNGVRFELGDIVKINCTAPGKGKLFSKFMYARIGSLNPRKEDCSVTVSVLDRHERTLIDGGNTKGSPSELTIDSLKNIVGHVLLLKSKDFREIEDSYGGDVESVFIQKRCN